MARAEVVLPPEDRQVRGEADAIGCLDVDTPRGPVHCHDAPGFTTMTVRREGLSTSIGILTYDPDRGVGLIAQMGPTEARLFAQSLNRLADEVESEQRGRH